MPIGKTIVLDARHFAETGWQIGKGGRRVATNANALHAIRQAIVNLLPDDKVFVRWELPPDDSLPLALHSGQLPVAKFREA